MDELSVLETGLGRLKTQRKTIIDASKDKCETTEAKIELISNSSPHRHFTKHLISTVEEEPPCENNLN
jgi:hypothetical protein